MRSLALGLAVAALATAAQAQIRIENARARASLGGTTTAAAYVTLVNTGRAADRLLGASCACANRVDVHETVTTKGVARMRPSGPVAIPAGASAAFAPGGRHLMLVGVKQPIRAGQTVSIVLKFEKAGTVTVPFKATDTPEAAGGGHRRGH